jgi:arabinosyltransferase C
VSDSREPFQVGHAIATQEAGANVRLDATASSGTVLRGHTHRRHVVAWLLIASTLVLAVALPLAPVRVDTPTVSWPLDRGAPRPTIAQFMPYRPIDVTVATPCRTLAAMAARTGTDQALLVLGTALEGDDRGLQRSLYVRVGHDTVTVTSSGQQLWSGAVPAATDCDLVVAADQSGSRVQLVSAGSPTTTLTDRPDVRVPEVVAFTTEVSPADGPSPAVTAHPDARFQTSPTSSKIALILVHVVLLVGCLAVLRWSGPPRDRRPGRATGTLGFLPALAGRRREAHDGGPSAEAAEPLPGTSRGTAPLGRRWRVLRGLVDGSVLVTLIGWTALGPIQTDDYYYALEARTLGTAGYVGNEVRYFNVPEIPFVLDQTLLAPLARLSASPFVLRLPSLIAAVVVWWLLTRRLVPAMVERPHPALRVVAALAFLAWWLPWNTTTRPEPLVTLAWAVTLALALAAIERRRVWLIGVAAMVAGVAATITASGLSCAVTLVILLPRFWPILRASRVGAWAATGLVVACGSVASTIVFCDATLSAALTALRVHNEVGPSEPWWREPVRYYLLTLGNDPNQRSFARQVAVLSTVVVLAGVSVGLHRATRTPPLRTAWAIPALTYIGASLALVPSPTKWTHHLGALAAPGALTLTVAAAVIARRRPDRWASAGLIAALALAGGLAFHGGNSQVEYSSYGVRAALPAVLGDPIVWLAIGAVTALVCAYVGRRAAAGGQVSLRDGWVQRWPEGVLGTLAAILVVALAIQGGSTLLANWRLRDTWSMARDTVDSVTGRPSCGFADYAVVGMRSAGLPAFSAGSPPDQGSGGLPPGISQDVYEQHVPSGSATWSTWRAEPTEQAVQSTTPWFSTAELGDRDQLAVAVTGRPTPDTNVQVQYATTRPDGSTEILTTAPVGVAVPAAEDPAWQQVVLGPRGVFPAATTLARLQITDQNSPSARSDGWVAATDPYRLIGQTLSEAVPRGDTVVVDWPLGFNMPCFRPPRVADGMVEPAEWLVQSATFAGTPPLTVIDGGGSFSTSPSVSSQTVYPGFVPGVFPYTAWGNLIHWTPELPTGGYRLTRASRVIAGWKWWPGAGPGPSPE